MNEELKSAPEAGAQLGTEFTPEKSTVDHDVNNEFAAFDGPVADAGSDPALSQANEQDNEQGPLDAQIARGKEPADQDGGPVKDDSPVITPENAKLSDEQAKDLQAGDSPDESLSEKLEALKEENSQPAEAGAEWEGRPWLKPAETATEETAAKEAPAAE